MTQHRSRAAQLSPLFSWVLCCIALMTAPPSLADPTLTVSVDVCNTGSVAGDEVVQVYVRDVAASVPVARHSLQAFRRIHLAPGERVTVDFELEPRQFALVDADGVRCL